MNYALMKTTEHIRLLRQFVAAWDERPLSEAEASLFGRVADALASYDFEIRHGNPPAERVCLLCGKLRSKCYC